jgi:hypothetical protein
VVHGIGIGSDTGVNAVSGDDRRARTGPFADGGRGTLLVVKPALSQAAGKRGL